MLGPTHLLAGVAATWLLPPPAGVFDTGAMVVGGLIGGLFPDLDAPISLLSAARVGKVRPLLPLAWLVNHFLGHRGILHSLIGLGVFALIAGGLLPVIGPWGWASFVLGYTSHLLLDSCTVSGIPLLFIDRKSYHLLPKGLRFHTTTPMSQPEQAVFMVLAVLAVGVLVRALFFAPVDTTVWLGVY